MAHDVFICHSSKDKIAADAACAVLESHGLRCWIAPRDATPGKSWAAAIVQAINSSKVMLLVFSRNANESPQIEREVERALNQRIPVVTFRIEDIVPTEALEYFISADHWLDAFSLPVSRHYEVLVARIKALLDGGQPLADVPPAAPTIERHAAAPRSGVRWSLRIGLLALAVIVAALAAWLAVTFARRGLAVAIVAPARGPVIAWSYPTNLDPNGDYWLALRSEPSGASGVRLAKLGPDTLFVVTGSRGPWSQVRLADGRTGWVFSRYVGCCRAARGP